MYAIRSYYADRWLRAIESHGYGIVNDIRPETECERALYAVDELTGLVAATAVMRPSKSVLDVITSYSIHYTKLYDKGVGPFILASLEAERV